MPQPPWATQTPHFGAIPQPLEVPPTPSSTAASEMHPPMWRHTDPDLQFVRRQRPRTGPGPNDP
eukprot:1360824-Pleurochrysis_carterae.AAC.1